MKSYHPPRQRRPAAPNERRDRELGCPKCGSSELYAVCMGLVLSLRELAEKCALRDAEIDRLEGYTATERARTAALANLADAANHASLRAGEVAVDLAERAHAWHQEHGPVPAWAGQNGLPLATSDSAPKRSSYVGPPSPVRARSRERGRPQRRGRSEARSSPKADPPSDGAPSRGLQEGHPAWFMLGASLVLHAFDSKGDGMLDLSEFNALQRALAQAGGHPRGRSAPAHTDASLARLLRAYGVHPRVSGRLSVAELATVYRQLGTAQMRSDLGMLGLLPRLPTAGDGDGSDGGPAAADAVGGEAPKGGEQPSGAAYRTARAELERVPGQVADAFALVSQAVHAAIAETRGMHRALEEERAARQAAEAALDESRREVSSLSLRVAAGAEHTRMLACARASEGEEQRALEQRLREVEEERDEAQAGRDRAQRNLARLNILLRETIEEKEHVERALWQADAALAEEEMRRGLAAAAAATAPKLPPPTQDTRIFESRTARAERTKRGAPRGRDPQSLALVRAPPSPMKSRGRPVSDASIRSNEEFLADEAWRQRTATASSNGVSNASPARKSGSGLVATPESGAQHHNTKRSATPSEDGAGPGVASIASIIGLYAPPSPLDRIQQATA